MALKVLLVLAIVIIGVNCQESFRREWTSVYPCKGNDKIKLIYENTQPNDQDFQFYFTIRDKLPATSNLYATFGSTSYTEMSSPGESDFRFSHQATLNAKYFVDEKNPTALFTPGGKFWYMKSLLINRVEYCQNPDLDLDDQMNEAEIKPVPVEAEGDKTCGKRQIPAQETNNGADARPGDWPWHAAIIKTDEGNLNYICGGTLLSKSAVLTAAHCVSNDDQTYDPQTLSVVLGRQFLLVLSDNSQKITVRQIIVHPDYNHLNMDSDVALLVLSEEATFNDFVQPACLWRAQNYYKINSEIEGTVAGWGFGNTDTLANKLRYASLPKTRQPDCVRETRNLEPFSSILNYQSFCVKSKDGISPCISDSGSGFITFVPDEPRVSNETGSWYIRGVASYSAKLPDTDTCDSDEPVIFTDIAVYIGWMAEYIYSI